MRAGAIAAVVVAAGVVTSCGLDRQGLGDLPGLDASGDDALAAGDVTSSADADAHTDGAPGDAAEAGEGGTVGDAPADSVPVDSPAPPDAACPPGVLCNGVCTSSVDCRACSGAPLLCAGTSTCTSDCTACPASPTECFACDMNRANPIGTCQPSNPLTYCLDTNYAGAYAGAQGYHCGCTTAADCPGATQVCIAVANGPFACFTCGEAFTDMATCNSGKGSAKCVEAMAMCK